MNKMFALVALSVFGVGLAISSAFAMNNELLRQNSGESFIDLNNDGICDNYESREPAYKNRKNCTDSEGNIVCGNGKGMKIQRQLRKGAMNGKMLRI